MKKILNLLLISLVIVSCSKDKEETNKLIGIWDAQDQYSSYEYGEIYNGVRYPDYYWDTTISHIGLGIQITFENGGNGSTYSFDDGTEPFTWTKNGSTLTITDQGEVTVLNIDQNTNNSLILRNELYSEDDYSGYTIYSEQVSVMTLSK